MANCFLLKRKQACWELNDDNLEREVGGLLAARSATGCDHCQIITLSQQQTLERNGIKIDVLPVWGMK